MAFPMLTPTSGELWGIPMIASDQVTSTELILLDAAAIVADTGALTLDRARQADIAIGSSVNVSLWQSNLTAVRVERFWSAVVSRPGSVAKITGL